MGKEKICCDEPPPCELTLEDLPCISIIGMSTEGWTIQGSSCCASINFTYDELQPLLKYDGGDVMSYDKTESYTRELFYFPITCGTVTQLFWEEGFAGFWQVTPPNEPTYSSCCNNPVVINSLTTTIRSRGGQRFIVCLRPMSINISLSKVSYICDGDSPVDRYILRLTKNYAGTYDYKNYNKLTIDYTLTDSSNCWNVPTNTSVGDYPFNIAYYTPSEGLPSIGWHTCREKILTELPTVNTNLTFLETDCPDIDCSFVECVTCVCELDCFSSGPTGDATPSFGFCDANILVISQEGLGSPVVINHPVMRTLTGHDCLRHKFYYWSAGTPPGNGVCDASVFAPDIGILGPINHNGAVICCGPSSQNVPSDTDWADQTNPTHYGNISGCAYLHEFNTYTTINGGAGSLITPGAKPCPTYKPSADISCFPSYTCPICPLPGFVTDLEWEMNTVTAGGTETLLYPLYCRTSDATRIVSCSGYMEKEICPVFQETTITIGPCGPCGSAPCGWVWLAGTEEWIEDTFNCNVGDEEASCRCQDPPDTPGLYDGEFRLNGNCGEVI